MSKKTSQLKRTERSSETLQQRGERYSQAFQDSLNETALEHDKPKAFRKKPR